jgi:hypothetical protein
MLVRIAFTGRHTLWGILAGLVLFRLEGLAHALLDVFVISHTNSVAPAGPWKEHLHEEPKGCGVRGRDMVT